MPEALPRVLHPRGPVGHTHSGVQVMGTDNYRAAQSPGGAGGRPSLGQLWQVPVFFAGLVAVVAILAAIPLRHGAGPREMNRDIAAIRRALEQPGGAVERVVALAEKVLARADHEPARAGEAHFLLGSVYQRVADWGPSDRAPGLRDKALTHLRLAEKHGVPETDRPRLAYRL